MADPPLFFFFLELFVPQTDLLKIHLENSDLILFFDRANLKTETGKYQARYTLTDHPSSPKYDPLPEAKTCASGRTHYIHQSLSIS